MSAIRVLRVDWVSGLLKMLRRLLNLSFGRGFVLSSLYGPHSCRLNIAPLTILSESFFGTQPLLYGGGCAGSEERQSLISAGWLIQGTVASGLTVGLVQLL